MRVIVVAVTMGLLSLTGALAQNEVKTSPLRTLLQEREERLRNVKTVWTAHLRRDVSLTQAQATQMQEQAYASTYERALADLRAKGVPHDQIEQRAKEIASAFTRLSVPREIKAQTDYTVELTGKRVRVRGTAPTFAPNGVERMEWDIVYDEGVGIAVPVEWTLAGKSFSHNTPGLQHSGAAVPWVRVWKSAGHAAHYRPPRSPSPLFLTPEVLCLLSGLCPLGMYGGEWQVEHEDGSKWVLVQAVRSGEMAPFVVRIEVSKPRGGAVTSIEVEHSTASVRETYTVTAWRNHSGVWLPARIADARTMPIGKDRREWVLRQVGTASERHLHIPIGYPVADYRLMGEGTSTESASGKKDLAVGYDWTGQLPDEHQLRRMWRERNPTSPSQSPSRLPARGMYRFVPPIVLIVIGVMWYWRLRVRKGA